MKRERIHYNTVREICFAPEDLARLSDNLQENGAPCHISHLVPGEADPVRLAQVKDVIETVLTGRKYEVLLLRSQGKTYAEIALLLEISKSAVQSHYRIAIRRVQRRSGHRTRAKGQTPVTSDVFYGLAFFSLCSVNQVPLCARPVFFVVSGGAGLKPARTKPAPNPQPPVPRLFLVFVPFLCIFGGPLQ